MANAPPISRFLWFTAVFAFLLAGTPTRSATSSYVKPVSRGADDGTSWADADTDLQDALAAASVGNTIWVGAGTYDPTSTGDRSATFQPSSGVTIYGGPTGIEMGLSERDFVATGDASDSRGTRVTESTSRRYDQMPGEIIER